MPERVKCKIFVACAGSICKLEGILKMLGTIVNVSAILTGSVIGSGSSYGFDLAAGGGKIRVSDASDKNFLFFGKDTLQQNADAPNKLNLATKNGDVEVEFVR